MDDLVQISAEFIEKNTDFPELIAELKQGFADGITLVPDRHHHDFPNAQGKDTTMLLMPAWNSGRDAGVKIVTVNPENARFNLPSIQGSYLYMDSQNGLVKAILEAKSLTVKRTAAASALASSYLSNPDASSMLMIGTGALAPNLIKSHAQVRPIQTVYIWGRNPGKATELAERFSGESYSVLPVQNIEDQISNVDIISCATLSPTPLVKGKYLRAGQHIDLVGAYKPDMREGDDEAIKKASVFLDSMDTGLLESGDIAIPLKNGVLREDAIMADLFMLCSGAKSGRKTPDEITLFKSVGHALEDLVAARYYYDQFIS